MLLDELRKKKLILISGKGGVGKTTISAALALRLAQDGQRVLLAEIDSQEQIASLLGVSSIGYRETQIQKNLYGLNVTPMKAFEEYVISQIKFHPIYTAVFDNKFVRYFIEAAPGLAELMSIGKIYSMVDSYDVIVVDAPATGHGKSLLQIPTIVSSAVRVGPLKNHSEKIEALLRDSTKTALAVVTLPEEMPIAETLELEAWTQKNLGIDIGPIFINAVYPPIFTKSENQNIEKFFKQKTEEKRLKGLYASYRMRVQRADMHKHYQELLKKNLKGVTLVSIPFFFTEGIGKEELKEIGKSIT